MMLLDIFQTFWQNVLDTTWLEVIAVLLGIASVWYARMENILVYPTGIISTVIYVFICFSAQLYADAGINFYYTAASLYGWYAWTHNTGDDKPLEITVNSSYCGCVWVNIPDFMDF